jgi:pilus assembly protein CpaB
MGALAVGLAAFWLGRKADLSTTSVVVASKDVEISTALEMQHLNVVAWPALSAPKGAIAKPEDLVGRVVNTSLVRGEPVLEGKLSPPGSKGGMSALIAPGKRAVSVRVNEVVGVAGFTLPGNFVDIVVNMRDASGTDVSKIILEKVLVLAVAQQADRDETKPRVVNAVTLELSPEQVEVLDLARSVGQLSLVLRNQFEVDPAGTTGARRQDLLTATPPARAVAEVNANVATAVAARQPKVVVRKAVSASTAASAAAPKAEPKPEISVEVMRGLSRTRAEFVQE